MTSENDPSKMARQLLASSFGGLLATHSVEHPGYPFGSVAPFMLDRDGLPLFLLSHLSQHTKNVDDDPRCCLTTIETGEGDLQQRGRLSGIGDFEAHFPPVDTQRFFRYFPHMQMYHAQLGFRFYRFRPARFHWNGGFATARWFGAQRLLRANPFSADEEYAIVEHMNRDHGRALRHYLGLNSDLGDTDGAQTVGIDMEGVDLRVQDRLYRVELPREIGSPHEAHEVLVEMAAS